jgi:hypothetical protein
MVSIFATHPPLVKRIQSIEPGFNGQFTHINSLPRQPVENARAAKYDRLCQENLHHAPRGANSSRLE